LEGLLLGSWLALQPGVDGVEFPDYSSKNKHLLEKAGVSGTVKRFLSDKRGDRAIAEEL
jgi:hypothetical protein